MRRAGAEVEYRVRLADLESVKRVLVAASALLREVEAHADDVPDEVRGAGRDLRATASEWGWSFPE